MKKYTIKEKNEEISIYENNTLILRNCNCFNTEELNNCCGALEFSDVGHIFEVTKRRFIGYTIPDWVIVACLIKATIRCYISSNYSSISDILPFGYINVIYKNKGQKQITNIGKALDELGLVCTKAYVNPNSGNKLKSYTVELRSFYKKEIVIKPKVNIL
jgi:hypothetical protein